ncbi:Protein pelota-like protein [Aphelenchoides besseyi]|nr:Protein pelota-like protein [Aphelenchoides besseyi]KAI6200784.1 Protein pelota-like protein [Aphelenchoides besseyi]
MKILRRHIDRNGLGFVTLICDEEEDVWHVYNLIRPGDNVRCSTLRKVTTETQTGSKNSQRVHVTLTILVETITYDPTVCTLHLKGQNIQENEHVRMGAYHTLDIEINRQFTLTKEVWDSMDLERLQNSADITHVADVAAVVMHEGLANVCLLTSTMTVVKSKIDVQIARKRKGFSSQHDKSLSRFFEMIVQAFMKHVVMENLKCVIIASPGFLKEQLLERLMEEAGKVNAKDILQNRSKFLLVHSTSGFKHALKEVLADPAVANRISDTKAQAEVKALDTFMDLMNNDSARAVYGYNHVNLALSQLAIETLMISDLLFRSRNIQQRKKYVYLVEQAREQGVTVMIFSSMHVSGEQLGQLTGVAAILRYPIEGIDDDFEDDQANLQLPDEQWGDRDRVES